MTFSEVSKEFLLDREIRGKSNRTIIWYNKFFTDFNKWLITQNINDPYIEDITPTELKQYFAFLATQNYNQGGIHSAYRSLKAIFNFYDFEYDPSWENPIKKVKVSPNKTPPLPEIPLVNIQKLIDVTNQGLFYDRDRAILFTLTDTGVRASELLALNIGDVDLITGSVRVLHGKGNKYRIVFLGDKGRKAVNEYLKTRPNYKPEEPLFLNDQKKRLGMAGLRMLIRRLTARANIKYQGIHCFRRCFGLTMYRKSRDILLVSRLLGHSNTTVTLRYLNLNNDDLRSAHEANSPADMLN
jgi:site-specific recombinase XerD